MQTTINSYNPKTLAYWNSLKDLGKDVKLELISLLASSLKRNNTSNTQTKSAAKFYGAWKDDKPAEVLMKEIRDGRQYETRNVMSLD